VEGLFERPQSQARHSTGLLAVTNAFSLRDAPIRSTGFGRGPGMGFFGLDCDRASAGLTKLVQDEAFLVTLQLTDCPDFDLYADGKLIRPRNFSAGSIAIFDLRATLHFDLRAGRGRDIHDSYHAVDFFLTGRALQALAEDANARSIDELLHEPGTAFTDDVSRGLLQSIQSTLNAAPGETNGLLVDHVAMALATHVAHKFGGMRSRESPPTGGLAYWQERRATELLAANLCGNVTLAELATACDLSVRHFTRAFRGSTGMAPHAWLVKHKIQKAKSLLEQTPRILAEVALECGFADQSHFTRTFQRVVGMSPGAWRRLHRR